METITLKNSNSTKSYIAFFDLDRTIISFNSGKTFIKYALKNGLITRSFLIKGIWLSIMYKLNLRDPVKIIGAMVSWLKGVSEVTLNELSAEIFKIQLIKSIHQDVQAEINLHKRNGAACVMLSSSIPPVCQTIADYLEMDDIICSNLEIDNGIYTGLPSGLFCFGKEKAVRLLEYCKLNNINPVSSYYYGDSIADLPALSLIDNPRCVNPDKKLKRAANKRGWKILLWN